MTEATDILMPALSPTMDTGKLAKWLVAEGTRVSAGDVIAEIETDKATMEVEAIEDGMIAAILVPAGTEGVKVNTPIARISVEGAGTDKVPTAARAVADCRHGALIRSWRQRRHRDRHDGACGFGYPGGAGFRWDDDADHA
jgi:pyruvate dehydrogenase E1 component beta subunit